MIPTALLRDSVTVEAYAGDTASGPTYGPSVTYPARLDVSARMVPTTNGEAKQATAVAYLRPDAVIDTRSRVTYDGQHFAVLAVMRRRDLSRFVYIEATLGWWGDA